MAYLLKNDVLTVEIAGLSESYSGVRFDGSGIITGVTLAEGGHHFCVKESLTPEGGTGGIGLCSEFGIRKAIGYEEAKAGEAFPKLGVGLLTRPDDTDYLFYRDYACQRFTTRVEQYGPERISFITLPLENQGYAAYMEKHIEISEGRLIVEYVVENTGTKTLDTDEYSHNFFGIDGHKVGPEYVLRFPEPIQPWSDDPATLEGVRVTGNEVSWDREPTEDFYFCLQPQDGREQSWLWELSHRPSGATVRELSRLPLSEAAVWGHGHVVAPEMFVEVKLAPGERQSWTRIYEFMKVI